MNKMALLPGNHPLLRTPCQPVTFDDDVNYVRQELLRTCKEENGLGLAANQIGCNLRIFVIENNGLKAYINPEIIEASEEFIFDGEGCLSFPGEVLCTRRYKKFCCIAIAVRMKF